MANQVEAIGAKLAYLPAVIASGQTVSGAVDVNGRIVVGIDLGLALTGTALGIQNSIDGVSYRAAYDSTGAALSWTVAGDRYLKFDPPLLGYSSIKLVSGTAEAAARTLNVVVSP